MLMRMTTQRERTVVGIKKEGAERFASAVEMHHCLLSAACVVWDSSLRIAHGDWCRTAYLIFLSCTHGHAMQLHTRSDAVWDTARSAIATIAGSGSHLALRSRMYPISLAPSVLNSVSGRWRHCVRACAS